ncbi:MAG TPA: hypothetical protein VKD70_07355 [Candidatus Acidoferrum sp.]|nr:hypothetical protein [Candidatus Acidoferrum sp.]
MRNAVGFPLRRSGEIAESATSIGLRIVNRLNDLVELAHPASNTESKSNTGANFIGKSPKQVVNCAELGQGCFLNRATKLHTKKKLV